jgi:hypothetical protein
MASSSLGLFEMGFQETSAILAGATPFPQQIQACACSGASKAPGRNKKVLKSFSNSDHYFSHGMNELSRFGGFFISSIFGTSRYIRYN